MALAWGVGGCWGRGAVWDFQIVAKEREFEADKLSGTIQASRWDCEVQRPFVTGRPLAASPLCKPLARGWGFLPSVTMEFWMAKGWG